MSSGFKSDNKNIPLEALVARVPDGASLALGGSFLHRGPFSFVRELIRQKKTNLEIIKQSPGYDIDILCRAGVVKKVRARIRIHRPYTITMPFMFFASIVQDVAVHKYCRNFL